MRLLRALFVLLTLAALSAARADDALLREALAAEARLDSRRALELFLQLQPQRPQDAVVAQKIAQQYSDLIVDLSDVEEKKRYARLALEWSQRAVQLDPNNAVAVLSLAVCHGKLGTYSDTRTKVKYSRLVREEAERALALDPNYAWAHHVLGRWHREVANLGATARFFVRLFYGGLPDASVEEAVKHLERAVALQPDDLNHVLELGFAYAAAGDATRARTLWERGLAMTSRGKHDEPAKKRAREALADLG
jgi:tetratricopeptide (TPR) repeat protein